MTPQKIALLTDSCADLSPQLAAENQVFVVPLRILCKDGEYRDGVDIHAADIYARLRSGELPQTSLPAAQDISDAFDAIAAAGYDNIYVVDSSTAAIGAGILAEYALACLDRGMDAAGLARALEQKRQDVCVLALVDTLEYLKRGGRISKTTALAGGLLNIKPVLTIENGEILLVGKARGSRQGNNLLVEKIRACGGIDFSLPILLGYTGLTDVFLKKYVEDSRALWENGTDRLDSTLIGGVIGTHAGPGAVAVAFFRKR